MKKREIIRRFSSKGPVVSEKMFKKLPDYDDVKLTPFNEVLIPMRLVYGKSEWFIAARFDEQTVFGFVVLEGSEDVSSWGVITIDSLIRFSGVSSGNMVVAGGLVQVCWSEELKTRNAENGCRVDTFWKPKVVAKIRRIFLCSQNALDGLGNVSCYYF